MGGGLICMRNVCSEMDGGRGLDNLFQRTMDLRKFS